MSQNTKNCVVNLTFAVYYITFHTIMSSVEGVRPTLFDQKGNLRDHTDLSGNIASLEDFLNTRELEVDHDLLFAYSQTGVLMSLGQLASSYPEVFSETKETLTQPRDILPQVDDEQVKDARRVMEYPNSSPLLRALQLVDPEIVVAMAIKNKGSRLRKHVNIIQYFLLTKFGEYFRDEISGEHRDHAVARLMGSLYLQFASAASAVYDSRAFAKRILPLAPSASISVTKLSENLAFHADRITGYRLHHDRAVDFIKRQEPHTADQIKIATRAAFRQRRPDTLSQKLVETMVKGDWRLAGDLLKEQSQDPDMRGKIIKETLAPSFII